MQGFRLRSARLPFGLCVTASFVAVMVGGALALGLGPGAHPARAACGDPGEAIEDIWVITEPPSPDYVVQGEAPLTVTITITGGVLEFGSDLLTTMFDWGDGSAAQGIAVENCGDELTSFWAQQSLTHVYQAPGQYQPAFVLATVVQPQPFRATAAIVIVTPAQQPTPAATATLPPGATATPAAGTTPAPGSTATPTAIPTGSTTAAPATATPTPTPTATPTPAPTGPPAASPSAAAPTKEGELPESPDRPDFVAGLDEIGDISTSPSVVSTNLVIAGATIWILFSSVLLNQLLQSNRDEVDRRTAWLRRPATALRKRVVAVAKGGGRWRMPAEIAGVLALTGAIYTLAEPGLGFNRQTATLFTSVVLGIGIISYVVSGAEVVAARRILKARAAVRPYAATIAVAAASLVVTRLFDLRPGVVYGFIASTALLSSVEPDAAQKGRIAVRPVTLALMLSVGAWLLVGPIRSAQGDSSSWLLAVAEATAVVVFVGGIEGTLFGMIPIAATDGGKLFRWNRWVWAVIALVAAFLTWHVLLGREQAYFGGLREASSITMLVVFGAYTALTVAAWAYFARRKAPQEEKATG